MKESTESELQDDGNLRYVIRVCLVAAMSIATIFLWAAKWVISQTFPMLDENPWLVDTFNHGFAFWLYGLMCILLVIFVWLVVPETKGKSLEEIEGFWMKA